MHDELELIYTVEKIESHFHLVTSIYSTLFLTGRIFTFKSMMFLTNAILFDMMVRNTLTLLYEMFTKNAFLSIL